MKNKQMNKEEYRSLLVNFISELVVDTLYLLTYTTVFYIVYLNVIEPTFPECPQFTFMQIFMITGAIGTLLSMFKRYTHQSITK